MTQRLDSATTTKDSVVILPKEVAAKVLGDLKRKDAAEREIALLKNNSRNLLEIIDLKDSLLFVSNKKTILAKEQLAIAEANAVTRDKQHKKEKRRHTLLTGTLAILLALAIVIR